MATKKKKRSSASDVMLVPVDRSRQRRIRVYLTLAALLAPLLAFFAGEFYANHSRVLDTSRAQALEVQVATLTGELQEARDNLAMQRTDSEVSMQAQETVRTEIKDLRDQIAELDEAVAFYKNVMAPGSGDSGLRIEKLDVAATKTPGMYTFRLVLTQVGDNRGYLSGNYSLSLSGRQGEEAIRLNGSEVLADGAETRFKFRYFQELSGRISLPEDIEPDQLTIKAVSTGRRPETVERNFIWQLQEKNSAWAG
jgi:uncharacterized protein DUF6776